MNKGAFIFLFFLTTLAYSQETIIGRVIAITDGDTFKLLTKDSIQLKIRLANIDCPERKQPFSKKAKQFASDAIFAKTVTIHVSKKDRYGRSIANVFYNDNDSLNLSHELVKHGLAWHYIQYSKDKELQKLEDQAKENKLGLWSDPNAIPPWEWRKTKH